jgi:predicted DCC family thiol-disulfide oxidoreductase YuxK
MFSLHTIIASSDLDKKAVFVMVSSNFKLESVISHETSEQHLRSVGKQSAKENLTVNSAAAKIVQSLNKNVFNRSLTLHITLHSISNKIIII